MASVHQHQIESRMNDMYRKWSAHSQIIMRMGYELDRIQKENIELKNRVNFLMGIKEGEEGSNLLNTTEISQSGEDGGEKGHRMKGKDKVNQNDQLGSSVDQEAQRSRQNVQSLNESFFSMSSQK